VLQAADLGLSPHSYRQNAKTQIDYALGEGAAASCVDLAITHLHTYTTDLGKCYACDHINEIDK